MWTKFFADKNNKENMLWWKEFFALSAFLYLNREKPGMTPYKLILGIYVYLKYVTDSLNMSPVKRLRIE